MISSSGKWGLYDEMKNKYLLAITGLVSEVMISLITYPFESIKNNMQMNNWRPFFLEVCNNYPHKTLYRAYSKTLTVFFPLNDHLKNKNLSSFMSSVISAIVGVILIHPFEYWRTVQIYDKEKRGKELFYNIRNNFTIKMIPKAYKVFHYNYYELCHTLLL